MHDKLNIFLFASAFVLLCVFIFILPADPGAESYENRSMSAMPELNAAGLLNGRFAAELESFLCDGTAYRTSFLRFANSFEPFYGFKPGGATMAAVNANDIGTGLIPDMENIETENHISAPATAPDPLPAPPPHPTATLIDTNINDTPEDGQPDDIPAETPAPAPDTTDLTETVQRPRVNPFEPFGLDVYQNENAVLYERYTEKINAVKRYAEILNEYRGGLGENIRIFSVLIPTRVEFMGEKYMSANDKQSETIKKINDMLDERIIKVDAYGFLEERKAEYIYFRTDHHWTALGAYYAYLSFAEAAGFAPVAIGEYVEQSVPGFIGSLARGTNNKTVLDHPDTIYYYELDNGTVFSRRFFYLPDDPNNLSYRIFMGGDYAKLDFTSSNKNGNTVVVLKDSFANALIPWLAPSYERIIVIDPRQFDGSVTNLLNNFDQADLVFVDYVAATTMSDFIEKFHDIK